MRQGLTRTPTSRVGLVHGHVPQTLIVDGPEKDARLKSFSCASIVHNLLPVRMESFAFELLRYGVDAGLSKRGGVSKLSASAAKFSQQALEQLA